MSIFTDGYKNKDYCLQIHYLCPSRFMPSTNYYYSHTFINSILVSKIESDVAKYHIICSSLELNLQQVINSNQYS